MSRPRKAPRLWLRPARRGADGRIIAKATWIIKDGGLHFSTGCGESEAAEAEQRLAAYLAEKHEAPRRERRLHEIPIADVIGIYSEDVLPGLASLDRAARSFDRLLDFWGDKSLADVTGVQCRAYVAHRGNTGGARRDLQNLSAAIGHHHEEGYHREDVRVSLPPAGKRRERWLTRSELARLIWTCWRMREQMRRSHDDKTAERLPTAKRTMQHVARFILVAYYTGSRSGAVLTASWFAGSGRSYFDLDSGMFYRLAEGVAETNKRQPPVRVPDRLLTHARRWKARGICAQYLVEWQGEKVGSVKTAFNRAAIEAKLDGKVNRHTLRHTTATHLKQRGVSSFDVGAYIGASEATVERTYGHHDPNKVAAAHDALRNEKRPTTKMDTKSQNKPEKPAAKRAKRANNIKDLGKRRAL